MVHAIATDIARISQGRGIQSASAGESICGDGVGVVVFRQQALRGADGRVY